MAFHHGPRRVPEAPQRRLEGAAVIDEAAVGVDRIRRDGVDADFPLLPGQTQQLPDQQA